MAFHDIDFETYVFLGDPTSSPLWNWDVWPRNFLALDPLIKTARGKAACRSTQYLPNRRGTVKFGRIGWNENDQQKWSHGSPVNRAESKEWNFLHFEVWAPSWNFCEREGCAPDVFLSISNEALGNGYRKTLKFNPLVILAVQSDLAVRESSILTHAIHVLRERSFAKLIGYRRRPWGYNSGTGFTNSIQDLGSCGLFKPGSRHEREVGFDLFLETWDHMK